MGQALVLYNCQCISDMCLEIENFWLASQRNPMPKLITFLYNNMSSFLSFTICICLKFYVANNISKNSDQLQYSSTWGMNNVLRLISILVVCISCGDCLVNQWVIKVCGCPFEAEKLWANVFPLSSYITSSVHLNQL